LLDAFLIQAIAAPCIINIPAGRLISRTAWLKVPHENIYLLSDFEGSRPTFEECDLEEFPTQQT
jgi:hypothetical protein